MAYEPALCQAGGPSVVLSQSLAGFPPKEIFALAPTTVVSIETRRQGSEGQEKVLFVC